MTKLWQFKGLAPLPPVKSSVLPWDRTEALQVLPPRNEARYAARVVEGAKEAATILDNLCDAELLKVGEVVDLMKTHDWTHEYSDDGDVYRRGMRHEKEMLAALKALRPELAQAVWTMYSPRGGLVPLT